MNKVLNVVLGLLMLAAVIGGVILVGQNQETRKGAASNDVGMSLQPSSGNYSKGQQIEVSLYLNTGADSANNTLVGYEARLTYDPAVLKYVPDSVTMFSNLYLMNDGAPLDAGETSPNTGAKLCNRDATTNKYICNSVCKCAYGVEKDGAGNLLLVVIKNPLGNEEIVANPAVKVASVKFEVLADNGAANVDFNGVNKVTVGSSGETEWDVTTKTGASYTIGNETGGITTVPTDTVQPTAGVTGTGQCTGNDKKCVDGVPIWCVMEQWQTMAECGSGKECNGGVCVNVAATETAVPTAEPTVVPTATTAPVDNNSLYLNFKTTMFGVTEANKCADGMVATVIMKSGVGATMVYKNVPMVKNGVVAGKPVYNVSLKLNGWTETNNLLAFVKGPKHMQMKFGEDGQIGIYDGTIGKISVSAGASSPVYDFTSYPMMPGDVDLNGKINGVDFSAVKSKASVYEKVGNGGYLQEDVDGSCMVNTLDIGLLVKSLDTKQDEIY